MAASTLWHVLYPLVSLESLPACLVTRHVWRWRSSGQVRCAEWLLRRLHPLLWLLCLSCSRHVLRYLCWTTVLFSFLLRATTRGLGHSSFDKGLPAEALFPHCRSSHTALRKPVCLCLSVFVLLQDLVLLASEFGANSKWYL